MGASVGAAVGEADGAGLDTSVVVAVTVVVIVVAVRVSSVMVGASTDCTCIWAFTPFACSSLLAAAPSDSEVTALRELLTSLAASGSAELETIVIWTSTVTAPANFLPS
jgi:hypothetical protein